MCNAEHVQQLQELLNRWDDALHEVTSKYRNEFDAVVKTWRTGDNGQRVVDDLFFNDCEAAKLVHQLRSHTPDAD